MSDKEKTASSSEKIQVEDLPTAETLLQANEEQKETKENEHKRVTECSDLPSAHEIKEIRVKSVTSAAVSNAARLAQETKTILQELKALGNTNVKPEYKEEEKTVETDIMKPYFDFCWSIH